MTCEELQAIFNGPWPRLMMASELVAVKNHCEKCSRCYRMFAEVDDLNRATKTPEENAAMDAKVKEINGLIERRKASDSEL